MRSSPGTLFRARLMSRLWAAVELGGGTDGGVQGGVGGMGMSRAA